MKVTVIVPAYNSDKTLALALDSIKAQSLQDFECLMINDGSTDDTLDVMARFAQEDKRFKIHQIEHSGVSKASNYGISKAKGDYICFVGADDQLGPRRLENAYNAALKYSHPLVMCGIRCTNGNEIGFKKSGIYDIHDRKFFVDMSYDIGHCANKLMKRTLIQGRFEFDEECDYLEDWLFNTELAFNVGSICYIKEYDYFYFVHDGSLVRSYVSEERKDRIMRAFHRQQDRLGDILSQWQKDLMTWFIVRAVMRNYK